MNKKDSRKIKQSVINVAMGVVFIVAVYMLYQVGKEIIATIQLHNDRKVAIQKLEDVQKENEYLVEQKDKLTDPEYVKNYARSGYMLTKDGEQIFYLPKAND